MHRNLLGLILSLAATATAGQTPIGQDPAKATVLFNRDILPILSNNCFRCHGPDEKMRKAKLRLDRHDGVARVITPGKSMSSELIRRVTSTEPDEVMPPPKSGRTLTGEQKELLRRWIDQGAAWSKHWAYEGPRRPVLPPVRDSGWCRNAIDRFILARLEREGLTPSPEAPRETLIRRLAFDLTGLPPTPAETDAFLADSGSGAYARLVERLLASPRFGEHMALDWLDGARYGDSHGFNDDYVRTMWPWRDWVIAALNGNMPFDRFTIEQIAGDLLPGATVQQKIASGFNRNNRANTESGSIDEEWRVENNVERVETTATVFLGSTMGCGRCHSHKYDPLSQQEFYSFFAFFNSAKERGVYVEKRGNEPPLVLLPTPEEGKRLQQLDAAIGAAESETRSPPARGKAPTGKKEEDGRAKTLAELRKKREEFQNKIASVMIMAELPAPRDTYLLKRGRYDMPDMGRKLEPGVPAFLPPFPADFPKNRLGLARWLVAANNPLTARVTVNRFWQHHCGTGLVKTAEDFGVQGEPPSHPELLDWLATEFIRTGWDMKAMHRLMVMSAAYRQASRVRAELLKDPENRLLARGPRVRLAAESVRDNALAISGLLVEKLGGPPVKPYQPDGLWAELGGGAPTPYVQDKGANLYRRSLYIFRKRTVPHPILATFDAPSREICQVKRQRTNTPLQALALLNDVTYVEAARHLARRLLKEGGRTVPERLAFGFRLATSRHPSPAELKVLSTALERYLRIYRTCPQTARQMLNHGESPRNDQLDLCEAAAYTAVAGIILNLDETITKE
jgi:hypothetical protein